MKLYYYTKIEANHLNKSKCKRKWFSHCKEAGVWPYMYISCVRKVVRFTSVGHSIVYLVLSGSMSFLITKAREKIIAINYLLDKSTISQQAVKQWLDMVLLLMCVVYRQNQSTLLSNSLHIYQSNCQDAVYF